MCSFQDIEPEGKWPRRSPSCPPRLKPQKQDYPSSPMSDVFPQSTLPVSTTAKRASENVCCCFVLAIPWFMYYLYLYSGYFRALGRR